MKRNYSTISLAKVLLNMLKSILGISWKEFDQPKTQEYTFFHILDLENIGGYLFIFTN